MEYQLTAQDYLFGGGIFITMVHALLLAAILFFNQRFSTKANKYLALAALGIAILLYYEFTGYTGVDQYIPWYIYELPIYMVSAIPVGIFYYVLFLIQPDHQLQKW
ncbi:MAG: hypothetical protein AAF806_14395, partial [Bacteroidota bacterium]